MKELSIFVDGSGDFGFPEQKPSYYLVTLLYHDQSQSIHSDIDKLDECVRLSGSSIRYIHAGPIIRREGVFKDYSIEERRKFLYSMLNFINHCQFRHDTLVINKDEAIDMTDLSNKITNELLKRLAAKKSFFDKFNKIIVYYDRGQAELSAVLETVFSKELTNVEFRKAEQSKYRLLQAADFICTFELINIKRNEKRLSKSEEQFFYKPNELKKTFLKSVLGKRLN